MNNNAEIKIIHKFEDILNLLILYKNRLASLRNGLVNPTEIAMKFSRYATVIECCEDKKSIGFCAFYHNDEINKQAFLSMIAVNSSFEGKGFASNLLSSMEEMCKESGMERISLEVFSSNQRAIDFYSRNGYITNNIKLLNGNIIMTKSLTTD